MSGLTQSEKRALNQLAHAQAQVFEANTRISLQQKLATLKKSGMSGEDAFRQLQVNSDQPPVA